MNLAYSIIPTIDWSKYDSEGVSDYDNINNWNLYGSYEDTNLLGILT